MLNKVNRLNKEKDFEKIFKYGRSYYSPRLTLRVVKNGDNLPRFGFVISKKVSKKAVVRNKIKRRLREIIRTNLGTFFSGFDCFFAVKPGSGIEKMKYQDLKEEVLTLAKKAKIS